MKVKDLIIKLFETFKVQILNWLKKEATEKLLEELIKKPWMVDIRTWFIKFAVEKLADYVIKPAIDYFFRKMGYLYEVQDGKHLLKKIANSADVDEWDQHTNGV